jgi:glyoxalase family protein
MHTRTFGLHHITGITGDPQKNLDFYEVFLGQRLIKKTVNFDDPSAYHLYYADAVGTPGTVLTFFYWSGIPQGQRGNGEVTSIYYAIPSASVAYWKARADDFSISCTEEMLPFGETVLYIQDPDGLKIGLVATDSTGGIVVPWTAGPIPTEHVLQGFYGVLIHATGNMTDILRQGLGYEVVAEKAGVTRYEATNWPGRYIAVQDASSQVPAQQGSGSIHHIAFQAQDDTMLLSLQEQVAALGLRVTPVIDRFYFHACYFMTPGGVLFELSTNDIGFAIDESTDELGEHLQLPPQFEPYRTQIESTIIPLTLPRHDNYD